MKKYLPLLLVFVLLALVASFISTPLLRNFVEYSLTRQTREVLLNADVASVQNIEFKHHFLQMPEDLDYDTQAKISKIVNAKVPGAYVQQPKPPVRVAINRNEDGSILMTGYLSNDRVASLWSNLAEANVAEGTSLENQVVVDKTVFDPNWNQGLYDYVSHFLATPGSQYISVDRNTITLRGEVASPYMVDELGGMAQNIIGSESSLRNELTYAEPLDQMLPFTLERVSNQKRFVLNGEAPDAVSRTGFGSQLSTVLEKKSIAVVNQLTIDHQVYPNGTWSEPVQRFAAHFAGIPGVTKLVADIDSISLYGEVANKELKTAIGRLATASVRETDQVYNNLTIKKIIPEPKKQGFPVVKPKVAEFPPVVAVPVEPVVNEDPKLEVLSSKFKETAIYFDTNSSAITEWGSQQAEQISKLIKSSDDDIKLVVGGYADNRGNAEYNKNLSLQRAQSVKDHLVRLGIPAERMTLEHFGEDTSNLKPEELWKSRRVELSLEPKNNQ